VEECGITLSGRPYGPGPAYIVLQRPGSSREDRSENYKAPRTGHRSNSANSRKNFALQALGLLLGFNVDYTFRA
jgi:hypothetical protein